MMVLHICIDQEGPLLIFGSKGHGFIWPLIFFFFLPFPHENSISFWYTMMVLHTCIDHEPRRTSIDFGVKMSRYYLDFELFTVSAWKLHFFLVYTYIDHDPRRTSIDFGVKRLKFNVIFGLNFRHKPLALLFMVIHRTKKVNVRYRMYLQFWKVLD